MIKVAIVEDNGQDAAVLTEYLDRYAAETGEEVQIRTFSSGFLFLDKYVSAYDVVFMDIEMPAPDGMATARKLREFDGNIFIIFVTNIAKYAICGYEVNALDYFLKPCRYADLFMRMERIRAAKRKEDLVVTVPFRGGVKCFRGDDIIYIESFSHTITFHTKEGVYDYRGMSMKELDEKFSPFGFFRSNTSYIVNLKYCTEINGSVVTVGGEELQISRARKKEFVQALMRSFRL